MSRTLVHGTAGGSLLLLRTRTARDEWDATARWGSGRARGSHRVAAPDAGTTGNEDEGRPWIKFAGKEKERLGNGKRERICKTNGVPV